MNIKTILSTAALIAATVVPTASFAQVHTTKTVVVHRGPMGHVHRTVVIKPRHHYYHRRTVVVRHPMHHTTVVHHPNGHTTVIKH